jgi:hypothetical protein
MAGLTPEQARDLVDHFGGQRATTRATGIPRTTLQSWLDPETARDRMARIYAANPEAKQTANQEHYHSLTGTAYARRQLQMRRVNALRCRANRHQRRASGPVS